jgi:hypothetical protein
VQHAVAAARFGSATTVDDARAFPELATSLAEFASESTGPGVALAAAAFGPEPLIPVVVIPTRPPGSFLPRPDGVPTSWTVETFRSEDPDTFRSETSPAFRGGDEGGSGRPQESAMFANVLTTRSRRWAGAIIGAAVAVILVAAGMPASRWLLQPPVPAVTTGTLVIVTNPPGAIAIIDGTPGGTTPVNQTVAAGSHTVELRGAGPSRTLAVSISAGEQAFQYIELPGAISLVGHLDVRSDPPGALVTIDGVARGTTPTVADLAPGEHTVMLTSERGSATQTVSTESGASASLMVAATSWSGVAP